ncbi:ROK family protein [Clostridium hydrogeniformans]|uniref:ROK family protein n=1 Tax=Clostridium hydrogeniformans TaxID=349933 RepID=UPI00048714FD|nr:ROK family protein [Clostridium hydrogeniformans]
MNNYICFDVGGTAIKYGVIKEDGTIIYNSKYDTIPKEEEFLKSIVRIVEENKKIYNVKGVSLSLPGVIDPFKGEVVLSYTLRFLEGKNIKDLLEQDVNLRVEIENDGKCAALSEKFNGNGKDCDNFICITVGTGIGGGIYVNGELLRGHNFMGGEFGFMITEGVNEGENDFNIVSDRASVGSLIRRYKKLKNIDINEKVEGDEIFEEAKEDKDVENLLESFYRSLSYCIFNLSGAINPERILLGGGVSEREDFIYNIDKHLNNIKWWKDIGCDIYTCKHKNNAGILGALYNFLTIKR